MRIISLSIVAAAVVLGSAAAPTVALADPTIANTNSISSCSFSPNSVTINQGDASPTHTQTLTGTPMTISGQSNMVYYAAYLYIDGTLSYGAADWWDEMASVPRTFFNWSQDNAGETHVWKNYATSQDLTKLNETVLCTLTATFGPAVPPVVSGEASPYVKPGETAVTTFSATATPASGTVSWSITGGDDQALFALSSDGVLTFLDAAAAGTYTVIVTATDNYGNVTNQTVTVLVSDIPPADPAVSGDLPATGFSAMTYGIAGGALLAAGAGFVALRRRARA